MAIKYVPQTTGVDSGSTGPFRTISYGIAQLASGDTLLVNDGNYKERITGTVTLKSINNNGAKIQGDWSNNTGFNKNTHSPKSQDQTTVNIPARYTGSVCTAINNSSGYLSGAQVLVKANNVTIDGFEIYDADRRGLQLWQQK